MLSVPPLPPHPMFVNTNDDLLGSKQHCIGGGRGVGKPCEKDQLRFYILSRGFCLPLWPDLTTGSACSAGGT